MSQIENADEIEAALVAANLIQSTASVATRISDIAHNVTLNPRTIFCQKTGAPIGMRDENSLRIAMKIRGQKAFENMLFSSPSLAVHPAWLQTDSDALDDLQELDAHGYASFCLGLMTARFYQSTKHHNAALPDAHERHWALARAWQILNGSSPGMLQELCVNLCRFLTYNSEAGGYLVRVLQNHAKQPDKLALLAVAGELIPILHRTIETALDSLGRADYFIKRDKLKDQPATVKGVAAKAPANVRGQKTSKRDVELATAMRAYDKIFGDIFTAHTPGTGAWIKRMAAEQQARMEAEYVDAKVADEFANLGDIFGDEDDNTVEVRTIPLERIVAASPIPMKIVADKPAPAPLSIMDRLKAIRSAVDAATPSQEVAEVTIVLATKAETQVGLSMLDQLRAMRGVK